MIGVCEIHMLKEKSHPPWFRGLLPTCDVLLQDSLLTTVKTVFPGEVTAKLSPTDDERHGDNPLQ
jgi:hypothetical protein